LKTWLQTWTKLNVISKDTSISMFFLDGVKKALQTYKLICKVLYGNLECNNHTKKKKKQRNKQDQTTITIIIVIIISPWNIDTILFYLKFFQQSLNSGCCKQIWKNYTSIHHNIYKNKKKKNKARKDEYTF